MEIRCQRALRARRRSRAFTLLEVALVVAIIGMILMIIVGYLFAPKQTGPLPPVAATTPIPPSSPAPLVLPTPALLPTPAPAAATPAPTPTPVPEGTAAQVIEITPGSPLPPFR